jgi:alpha-galactosidase
VPYFRKNARMVQETLVPKFTDKVNHWLQFGQTGGYLRHCEERLEQFNAEVEQIVDQQLTERSHEYGSYIIEAIETGRPIVINGNVPNDHLIDNLPYSCNVEVLCLVDSNGIQPIRVGSLPTQLAALNRTNINVQELTADAALTGHVEAVRHAVMLDPLTAAVCTLDDIVRMVDEMLEAQRPWLPQF